MWAAKQIETSAIGLPPLNATPHNPRYDGCMATDNPDHSILDELDHILADASEQIIAETRETTVAGVMHYFKMTRRQAELTLLATGSNIREGATILGLEPEDFLDRLSQIARITILAFAAGTISQRDLDRNADPATGDTRPES